MTTINSNFNTFSEIPIPGTVFNGFDGEYEYTTNNIFRKKNPPSCPKCDSKMVHNGFNLYTKKGMSGIKIGNYQCKSCDENLEEDRSVWEELKTLFINFWRCEVYIGSPSQPNTPIIFRLIYIIRAMKRYFNCFAGSL